MADYSGITLPFSVYGFGGDYGLIPPQVGNSFVLIPPVTSADPKTYAETDASPTPSASEQLKSFHADRFRCLECLSTVLILLFSVGCLVNLLSFAKDALHHKECRHSQSFLHLFAANFCMAAFFLSKIVVQNYVTSAHDATLNKVLVFGAILGENAVAFQLAYLAALRLREFALNKTIHTSWCNYIAPFVLWLVATPFAALYAFVEKSPADERSSEAAFILTDAGGLLIINTAFGSILPSAAVLFSFTMAFHQRNTHQSGPKEANGISRGVKEVACLYGVFIVCTVPFIAYRLWSTLHQYTNDDRFLLDTLTSFVALCSILIPLLHFTYACTAAGNVEIELSSNHIRDKESLDTISSSLAVSTEGKNKERMV